MQYDFYYPCLNYATLKLCPQIVMFSFVGHINNKEDSVYGKKEALVVDPEGFSKIIRHLASQTFTPNDTRLHLNKTVSEVHFVLENDTNVPDDLPVEGVYVKTAGGNAYWAPFCIITFTV